jgi:hypothetical protein
MLRDPMKCFLLIVLVSACGGDKPLPKGPPPEYENDPVLTQDAAPAPSARVVDAGAVE